MPPEPPAPRPAPPGADVYDPVAQPYGGPYPNGVDLTAGGADSSPHDTEATGERVDNAAVEQYMGRSAENTPVNTPQ